jgi:hypothetical protein
MLNLTGSTINGKNLLWNTQQLRTDLDRDFLENMPQIIPHVSTTGDRCQISGTEAAWFDAKFLWFSNSNH